MLLAIDIGNTHVVLGLYRQSKLEISWRLQSDLERTVDEYALELLSLMHNASYVRSDIKQIAICCVVPALSRVFVKLSRKYFQLAPLIVSAQLDVGVKILLDDPEGVGPDRIVNALAAKELFGAPAVVVDLGTATTFDVVSVKGDYLGGVIAPGILISAQALFEHAAMLPNIEVKPPSVVIGRNTRDAMMSGIVYGYVGLVDGVLARIIDDLQLRPKIIATGGLAAMVAKLSKYVDQVVPDLTLTGLRLIAERYENDPSPSIVDDDAE